MNHREQPHLPAGVRKALHCLSLLLIPAMAPVGAHALTRSRPASPGSEPASAPYLPIVGSMALRFQEAAPPPDLATRPPMAAPPNPALTQTETSVAMANAAAAHAVPATPAEPAAAPTTEPATSVSEEPSAPPAKVPPRILPDDVRPTVRPEDFLPFFQISGAAQFPADVTVVVPAPPAPPAPGTLPPSSATYTQSPR